ncbi:MAG TPA: DUF1553 domain-containing protein, partial [Gemmataceae bacterium]
PIPTADYYSLYGVFAASERPLERPLIADPDEIPGAAEFEKQAGAKRKELRDLIEAQYREITEAARQRVGDYLVKIATEPPDPLETAVFFLSLSPDDLRPQILARWRRYLEKHAGPDDPVFGPWNELMKLPAEGFAEAARQVTQRWQSVPAGTERGRVNPLVRDALRKATLGDRGDVARAYGEVLKRVYEGSKKSAGDLPEAERAAREQLLEILTGKGGPVYFPKSQTFLYMARVPRTTYGNLLQQLDKMAVESPSAPPRAMVLVDSPDAPQPRVFLRGNPLTPGETVPRRFLKVLSGEKRAPFRDGSGRLELAEAIADPDNPLTARVLVNRVWMHHFGEPLVQSPDDFGVRTPPPTHLELLDWLAATFVEPASRYAKQGGRRAEHGGAWSIKKLHRAIVLSSTYQQGSSPQPADPENRLVGRFPRRRLELEAMRDSLLAVSGRLDPAVGGRPVDLVADPLNRRRTVYGLVDRQDVPGMYRAFDFASPDQCAGRRPRTTVPQQALFGMNSPFVVEQAKALAARAGDGTPEERVRELYRLVLQRDPTGEEIGLGVRFVRGAEEER